MNKTRKSWNERWLDKAALELKPDPWLLRVLPMLPPGRVLDIACGRGRNALFLAERDFSVTGIDISDRGLSLLRSEAAMRGVDIDLLRVDLEENPSLPPGEFDAAIDFFYLQRSLFPPLMKSVRPGGIAIVRTFSRAGNFPGSPAFSEFVLEPGELLRIFAGWEILLHEEGLEPSSKGGSLAGIVARRPQAEGGSSPCA